MVVTSWRVTAAIFISLAAACGSEGSAGSGALVVPSCPGDLCTEGVNVGDRFYALLCWGVDSAAVANESLASGSGMFEEVRAIEGLPPELWLAARGELPCRPAQDQPLEHEWYVLESPELTIEERRQHLSVFRAVTSEP